MRDLDRVDDVRARHDAIMVGASTVRRDNPRLLVRDAARRARRIAAGRQESPAKVTVTTLKTGESFEAGHIDTAILSRSFA